MLGVFALRVSDSPKFTSCEVNLKSERARQQQRGKCLRTHHHNGRQSKEKCLFHFAFSQTSHYSTCVGTGEEECDGRIELFVVVKSKRRRVGAINGGKHFLKSQGERERRWRGPFFIHSPSVFGGVKPI